MNNALRLLHLSILATLTSVVGSQTFTVTLPRPVALTATALNTTTRTLSAPGTESVTESYLTSGASASCTVAQLLNGVHVDASSSCGTGYVGPSPSSSVFGPDIRLRIDNALPGTLVATATAGGSAQYSLDVGADGRWEIQGAGAGTREVLVCPNGSVEVRVQVSTAVSLPIGALNSLSYGISLFVVYVPRVPAASFDSYGNSTCGVSLSGSGRVAGPDRLIQLSLVSGSANTPAVFVLGTERRADPIPGSTCLLLLRPLAVVPVVTGQNGATLNLTIPILALPEFLAQAAALTPQLRVSSGLVIGMPHC